jgi:type IV fimbrial biogenesis protein FimT
MKSYMRGFTLIELMVTLAVMGVVLAIGLPSFQNFIVSSRLTTGANDLVVALNLARHEALRRGQRVSVCPSSDGAACAASGGWEQGYIVFSDGGTTGSVDGTDTVIRRQPGLASGYAATGNGNVDSYISFTASGVSRMASNALQAGTISLCAPDSSGLSRAVILSAMGRVRASDTGATCP